MGVPKFFRWLSERYPKIIDRHGSPPVQSTCEFHGKPAPDTLPPPDPLSTCTLAPEIDRLYIDCNGILHGCSHNNNSDEEEGISNISEAEIFQNVCFYLDRIVKDVAKPKQLVYIAIDGVAPRAKLNQQRARRYRSGKEGEIEQTVYDAHLEAMRRQEEQASSTVGGSSSSSSAEQQGTGGKLKEVEPGRFTGKFVTHESDSEIRLDGSSPTSSDNAGDENIFHSNAITPGTPFFSRCTQHIEHFLKRQIATDPAWQGLEVIFSGPNCPGEGEHKILQFLREQQQLPHYDPNLRHCIMGQDGDLIMLGLVTHEPNMVLLREQVLFGKKSRQKEGLGLGLDSYIFNPNFEFLHMNVLRDYLAYEFETENSPFCLEQTVDDFVFLTFLVGNDFLPHMPALDIADEAFDLIFYTYRSLRKKWLSQKNTMKPYLTDSGSIVSGKRLEEFLSALGSHEMSYYDYKKTLESPDQARKFESKYGMKITPSDEILESKEAKDRALFREMLKETQSDQAADFVPVLSSASYLPNDEDEQQGIVARMGNILQYSVTDEEGGINDQDLKGRYYYDKFGFSPFDAEKHLALRKAYIEGLVWNLKYYYEGCVSWEWYYPYHYGPMLSDLVGLDEILEDISFEGKLGTPLKPFEQLMACMPPSHSDLLPEPYRPLMTSPDSPVAEFYPRSFTVDMNGKRWPWEAVVLLPFIDSDRLLDAAHSVDPSVLTVDELQRNEVGGATVFHYNPANGRLLEAVGEGNVFDSLENCQTASQDFESSQWFFANRDGEPPQFKPMLLPGTETPLSGLPTLRDRLVSSVWRRLLRINVHGSKSRYKTSCLELENAMPEILPVDLLAQQLVGTIVYINYPHLIESFVTAVSDSEVVARGGSPIRAWNAKESSNREKRVSRIVSNYVFGEGLTGTGGISVGGEDSMEEMKTLLHVRPFAGLKTLEDGTVVKTYAKFEVEVPLFVTSWAPCKEDRRLQNIPLRLEKDPYNAAKVVLTDTVPNQLKDDEEKNMALKRTFKYSVRPSSGSRIAARGFHSESLGARDPDFTSLSSFASMGRNHTQSQRKGLSTFSSPSATRSYPSRHVKRPALTKASILRTPRGQVIAAGVAVALSFLPGTSGSHFYGVDPVPGTNIRSPQSPLAEAAGVHSISEQGVDHYSFPGDRAAVPPLEFAHGTTTLSFVFQGGIVAAVDSRASMGSFVGSKTTQKALPVNSHMLGTMAGGAADCSFWIRQLSAEAAFHELVKNGRRMSVARASRLLSNALYENRGMGLSIGTMLMGFDDDTDEEVPPRIFYIDNSGLRIEGDLFSVGSGSTFALGILDTERRFDMTDEEAVALGIKAIRHATFRDAYSGGFINVFLITRKDGWRRVYSEDLARLKDDARAGDEQIDT